ncbi:MULTISPECIES: dTDP-4-dehydrorhamnose reductase [Selenomonas]|uniref:dTDP-4-dehydrorhamnose reductase n=1 Tax=Selenomonas timonae TaxID=2754044 RepID=A0A7G7VLT2_9FIRM|nr:MULTISPECIES: dTDP-4-dehydrorhamnose reductase [Selenomonas]EKX97147.1 dTDP-4-dehydrorhamnose reductase [Selenomonas sp. oral taxon 138 str. F0429]QNH55075.1 dTDP-4-dehydrorhamnose reductase [Selenomonas timonae]
MKILITGATGQLGHDCVEECRARGHEVHGVSSELFPLSDENVMRAVLEAVEPDAILHAAAYTAVDQAEDEPSLCRKINAAGTEILARLARERDVKLLYISTDYVFPGTGDTPHETNALTSPHNVYGASKLAGEEAVQQDLDKYFIVRTSWVFGLHGKNFVKSMLQLAKTNKILSIVNDQIGSPTYTRDLAPLLADILESEKYGIYHATNEGFCSWAQFAREIFRQAGINVNVTNVPSHMYPTKATRPKNSRLSKKSLDDAGFHRLPPWEDAVGRFLKELKETAE